MTLKPHRPRLWVAAPRAVVALILREMSTTYGRSPGGYLWAVLEPALGIALLTVIFSMGFRAPSLGHNFPIFYATGMLPFMMYMDLQAKLGQALQFSKALLAYPRVSFVDALLARFILNGLTQLLVAYVIFSAILLAMETRTTPDLARIALSFALVAALGFGMGVMNCFLSMRFELWPRIWAIVNRPLFLISGIFFLFEDVPEPWRSILWFNPLVHPVGVMREGFYPYHHADHVSVAYVLGVALLLLVPGLLLLQRHHRALLLR